MSLESIKAGFINYIKDKLESEGKQAKAESITDSDISIFMYANDFKDYVSKELNVDTNLKSESISDILEMDVVNGKLVAPDENEDDFDNEDFITNKETGDLEQLTGTPENPEITEEAPAVEGESESENVIPATPDEEAVSKEETETGDETDFTITDLLNELLSEESIIQALDTDGSGELSKDEIDDFIKTISGSDGQEDNLSLDDILSAAESQESVLSEDENTIPVYEEIPTDETDTDNTKKTVTEEKEDKTKGNRTKDNNGNTENRTRETDRPTQNRRADNSVSNTNTPTSSPVSNNASNPSSSSSVPSSGGNYGGNYGGSYGGNSGSSSGGISSSSSGNTPQTTENMSLQELKSELKTEQGNLSDAKDSLSSILDGSNPEIKKKEEAVEENYEAYSKLLEEEMPEIAEEVEALHDSISEKEEEIDGYDQTISDCNSDISENETAVSGAKERVSGLESTKSELQSSLSSASDEDKASLQSQISQVEAEIKSAKEEQEKAEKALKEAKEKLKEAEKNKADAEKELKELEKEKEEYEQKINDEGSKELKAALEKYNDSKSELDKFKSDETEKAQKAVETAQAKVDEIQKAINTKETEEKQNKYAPSSLPADMKEKLDAKLGNGFSAKLEQMAKKLNCSPEDILLVMCSESGLNPAAVNSSSGATGLVQFMPATAAAFGTSTSELAQMSGVEQLDYVEKCFMSANIDTSKKVDAGTLYTSIFLPAYVNYDYDQALCSQGDGYYSGNAGLDTNGDGKITKRDLYERLHNNINIYDHL